MEYSQKIKTSSAIFIIILVLVAGYFLFVRNRDLGKITRPLSNGNEESMKVVVENTPMVNGSLSLPSGFPIDIPIEKGSVLESVTTSYPEQKAKQLSVSYKSAKTVTQKYTEYKDYMKTVGYELSEGNISSPVRAIFGTKKEANLSVAISSAGGKTLVQLSYLLKSL